MDTFPGGVGESPEQLVAHDARLGERGPGREGQGPSASPRQPEDKEDVGLPQDPAAAGTQTSLASAEPFILLNAERINARFKT